MYLLVSSLLGGAVGAGTLLVAVLEAIVGCNFPSTTKECTAHNQFMNSTYDQICQREQIFLPAIVLWALLPSIQYLQSDAKWRWQFALFVNLEPSSTKLYKCYENH